MSRIFIESYGCSSSQADAEIMAGLLRDEGFSLADREEGADLVILVTCYVKKPTEQKIMLRLRSIRKPLVVAGCMPDGLYSEISKAAPGASIVGTYRIREIARTVRETLQGRRVEYLGRSEESKLCLPRIRKNPLVGIVPISSGCGSKCSYCCVRLAKGGLVSYPLDDVVRDVQTSVGEGCREIWITAQDTASYSYGGVDLPKLLDGVAGVEGRFMIRVGMMNMNNILPMKDRLIESFRNEKIYKFFHLPVQSGSDSVLKSMNRSYGTEQFEEAAESFRKAFRCQIWTDVIVGYPTEDEGSFLETLEFVRRTRPDCVNISKFGARKGTEAARLKPLPPDIVNERSRTLSELARKISFERNSEWLGWEGGILISAGGKKNQWLGRNSAYKHVFVESRENLIGKTVRVRVAEAGTSHLLAELIE